ncbi:MAG: type II secretion system GspH family protein [Burkholderiales bacterium]|nr:type II secretion system GspH family protein [Burkholderiales bacterium]
MNHLRSNQGFTVIELVVTIVVIGVLAAVALPRFIGRDSFDARGFHDKAAAIVRLAQKTAVAWRRDVFVCVSLTQISAGTAAGCATPLTNPVNGSNAVETAPAGVTLGGASFSFDRLGRPSAAASITFTSTIPGDINRQISVAAETGYVVAN